MDRFFQVIVDGLSMLLSEQQLQSVYPNLILPMSEVATQIVNFDDMSNETNKKITILTEPQNQICPLQQKEQEAEPQHLAVIGGNLVPISVQPILQGVPLLIDTSLQKQFQNNINQNIDIEAHQLTMNEDEQVLSETKNTDSESPNDETNKPDNLLSEKTESEATTVNAQLKSELVCKLSPGVITVPPDVDSLQNCANNNSCDHTELVVETPDGQERRYFLNFTPTVYNIRRILVQICCAVGIDETMEAIIPDYLDYQSSEDKTDESEENLNHLFLQTNGVLTISPERRRKIDLRDGELKRRKCQRKHKKYEEPVCLTISSDEEGDDSEKKQELQNGLSTDENNLTTEVKRKEPNITEDTESPEEAITRGVAGGGMDFSELLDCLELEKALVQCRTVRIGSYKVVPEEKILLSEYGIKMKLPTTKGEPVVVKILRNEIVKVLVHFGKSMPVLFYYLTNNAGIKVRNILKMPHKMDKIFFDPTSKVEMHKRVILFPDKLTDDTRLFIKNVYDGQCLLEDLNSQEADEILLRVAPKDLTQQPKRDPSQNTSSITPSNIQTIMVYPPPPCKGGISINTEDYACLGEDQFLNDVIIDFYLKYIVQTSLSEYDQKRTHVFSSFFYKRLTTKCSPHGGGNKYQDDPKLNAAEKRHARVKGWTKSVDLFSKDFIIIPINENSHWFLGIICFPGLTSAVRMSDNASVTIPGRRKPKGGNMTVLAGGQVPATIGATTITMVPPQQESTISLEPDDEDRDEAEGDDDDLEPNTSDEESCKDPNEELLDEATHKAPKPTKNIVETGEPIKQPCILIFDSLAGASRSRVCATLREYLEVEYKVRNKGRKRDFSKDTLRGAVPKVPQQTNYTDCGLYVLQYVEAFFQKPITDYRMPIKMLKDWFTADLVSRKRYEIQQLLHRLMEEQNVDISRLNLPNLGLHPDGTSSHLPFSDEGEDEELEEEEEGEMEETLEEDEMHMDEEMDMDMEIPEEEGHSEEEDIGSVSVHHTTNTTVTTTTNTIVDRSGGEFFMEKNNFPYRHMDTTTLPCKMEPLSVVTSDIAKRKLPITLKEIRNPRLINRHHQIQENKKMRFD